MLPRYTVYGTKQAAKMMMKMKSCDKRVIMSPVISKDLEGKKKVLKPKVRGCLHHDKKSKIAT